MILHRSNFVNDGFDSRLVLAKGFSDWGESGFFIAEEFNHHGRNMVSPLVFFREENGLDAVMKELDVFGKNDPDWREESSAEIGERNRAIMFGEDGEAFPDDDEWSAWVD